SPKTFGGWGRRVDLRRGCVRLRCLRRAGGLAKDRGPDDLVTMDDRFLGDEDGDPFLASRLRLHDHVVNALASGTGLNGVELSIVDGEGGPAGAAGDDSSDGSSRRFRGGLSGGRLGPGRIAGRAPRGTPGNDGGDPHGLLAGVEVDREVDGHPAARTEEA